MASVGELKPSGTTRAQREEKDTTRALKHAKANQARKSCMSTKALVGVTTTSCRHQLFVSNPSAKCFGHKLLTSSPQHSGRDEFHKRLRHFAKTVLAWCEAIVPMHAKVDSPTNQ